MSDFSPVSLVVATQPTAALGYMPYCGPQAGELLTDPEFLYNSTEQVLAIPILTANPTANPPANTVFFYSVFTGGNNTLRIKRSDGTVVATGNLT